MTKRAQDGPGSDERSDRAERASLRGDGPILALLLLGAGWLLLGWFDAPIHRPQDEGQLLVYPELVLRGLAPQRDFFASYPPGIFWLIAAVYSAFGVSVASERAVGLAVRLAMIAGVYALARPMAGRTAAVLAALASLCTLLPLRLDAYAWIAGLALVLVSLALLGRAAGSGARAATAFAGFFAGLALLFRIDLALALLLSAAALLPAVDASQRRRYLLGAALGSIPLGVHVALVSPAVFFEGAVVAPVFAIGPLRRLGLGDLSTERLRQLGLIVLGLLALAAVAWNAHRRNAPDRVPLAALAGLAFGLVPQALQRLDEDHLLYVGAVVAALLPAAAARLARDGSAPRWGAALASAIVVLGFALPMQRLITWVATRSGPTRSVLVEHAGRALPVSSFAERDSLSRLVATLDSLSKPGDRLFVGPADLRTTYYNDTQLYFLLPTLEPASYFLEMNPGASDAPGSRLAADLAGADWVITTKRWDALGHASWRGSPEAAEVLRSDRFARHSEYGPWALYGRPLRLGPPRTSP